MITWAKYCEDMDRFNLQNPYADEDAFNRAYGVDRAYEPMVITPRNQKRPMAATLDNHTKEVKPKKPKAVKKPQCNKAQNKAYYEKHKDRIKSTALAYHNTMKSDPTWIEKKRAYAREYKRNRLQSLVKNGCAA